MYTWLNELNTLDSNVPQYRNQTKWVRIQSLLDTWREWQCSIEQENQCSVTYISRLLYPFAQLLKEQPKLENKIIFISDTRWMKPTFEEVDRIPFQLLSEEISTNDSRVSYFQEKAQQYCLYSPQNIRIMLSILLPKSSKLKKRLKNTLKVLFRTKSRLINLFLPEYLPHRGSDVFVKMSWVDKDQKVAKISIGRIPIPYFGFILSQLSVAYKIKNCNQSSDNVLIKFYRDLYLLNKRVFSLSEFPCYVTESEGAFNPLKIYPIIDGYVDIDRELFLQDTFFGRLVFNFYKFFQQKRSFLYYTINDLVGLEMYLKPKFNNIERVLANYKCSYRPGL